MGISLRSGEEIRCVGHVHWSSYFLSGGWAIICERVAVTQLISHFDGTSAPAKVGAILFPAIIGAIPVALRYLKNKNTFYIVTNQRIYVESGLLAKTKKDLPLQNLNDVELNQDLFQRLFTAGDLLLLTGNDKPTKIKNITDPDKFKHTIADLTGQFLAKAQ